MTSKFLVVFKKELRESLRDKRSLGLLALFTLMYPVLLGILLHQWIDRATKPEREGIVLAVIGGAQAPTLMSQLKQKNVTIRDTPAEPVGLSVVEAMADWRSLLSTGTPLIR